MAASVMRHHLPVQGHHTERCSLQARCRGPVGWGRGELPQDSGLINALLRREPPGAPQNISTNAPRQASWQSIKHHKYRTAKAATTSLRSK